MSAPNEGSSRIEALVGELAEVIEAAAGIVLKEFPKEFNSPPDSQWAADRQLWQSTYGSDEVAGWVSESPGIYLGETAQVLMGLATLFRCRQIFSTLDLVVRSVLERVGHINWILDERIDSEHRAARGGLELAASLQSYRESLSLLEGEKGARADLRKESKELRVHLEQWFEVEKPLEDPADTKSPASGDARRWLVAGEHFPTLTESARFALRDSGITDQEARGTYGGLSGFAHPNVAFSREHRSIDDQGHITFRYERDSIEKAARMAVLCFFSGVRQWIWYFYRENVELEGRIVEVAQQLESLCTVTRVDHPTQ